MRTVEISEDYMFSQRYQIKLIERDVIKLQYPQLCIFEHFKLLDNLIFICTKHTCDCHTQFCKHLFSESLRVDGDGVGEMKLQEFSD